ncbi:MAG: DUF4330 domain-containing protein [Oscillospiraceae bacterium]|nr:DUF4330 domain-containing protein [Oscillospiraceae bacterium]
MKKAEGKKGKLFGVINIIDLIVILLVLAVAAAVIWKVFGDKVTEALTSDMDMTYTVRCEGLSAALGEDLEGQSYPQQMAASGSYVNAHVTGVEVVPHLETVYNEDGTSEVRESLTEVDIIFTCTATVDSRSVNFPVGTQEVRVGKEHIVKTRYVEVEGFIASLELNEQ